MSWIAALFSAWYSIGYGFAGACSAGFCAWVARQRRGSIAASGTLKLLLVLVSVFATAFLAYAAAVTLVAQHEMTSVKAVDISQ